MGVVILRIITNSTN